MKNLLIDERPITVLPSLVHALGYSKAIILQQIHWLCSQPRSGKRLKDGNVWVWNTYEEWKQDYFPWLSVAMIRRHVSELESDGYLMSCKPSANDWDHTKYYRINHEKMQVIGRYVEAHEVTQHEQIEAPPECQIEAPQKCHIEASQKCHIEAPPECHIIIDTESSSEYPTESKTGRWGGTRPPKTLYPLTTSSSELNIWLDAISIAAGGGTLALLPNAKRWERICMELIRKDESLQALLTVIEQEKKRTANTPEYFSPDGCLKIFQASKTKAKQSKWMHSV